MYLDPIVLHVQVLICVQLSATGSRNQLCMTVTLEEVKANGKNAIIPVIRPYQMA